MIDIIIVFLSLFITDIAWAMYIDKVKNGTPMSSALLATFMFGVMAVGTISYVKNPWLLIPALFGAFAGTYVGVIINNRNQK